MPNKGKTIHNKVHLIICVISIILYISAIHSRDYCAAVAAVAAAAVQGSAKTGHLAVG